MSVPDFEWRGPFDSSEVESLHAAGFGREPTSYDWWEQANQHSLGWVCAREARLLVGFVNVAWDGFTHAFLLDTVVRTSHQRQGVGCTLVAIATEQARAAGCEWLHVDFDEHLSAFYFTSCGFRSTPAGVIPL